MIINNLMRNLSVFLIFLSMALASFTQINEKEKDFEILEYGFPSDDLYYAARKEISNEWNIYFKRVALCEVSVELMDSVKTHNDSVEKRISFKYGANWQRDFNDEINSLYERLLADDKKNEDKKETELILASHTDQYRAAIEQPESNILFRGYANKIIPSVTNNNGLSVTIQCNQCSVEKKDSSEIFYVYPGAAPNAYITVQLINGDTLIPIKTIEYKVMNVPDPQLYWGKSKSGEKPDIYSRSIIVKYPDGFALNQQFEIVRWKVLFKEAIFNGTGTLLSSETGLTDCIENSPYLSIIVDARGEDGKTRKIGGTWELTDFE